MDEHVLEQWYGPAARHSEHRRGERIMFLEEGRAYTGVILWIGASYTMEGGTILPMRYIVRADQLKGFPCAVSPGDVIERARWEP